MRTPPCDASFDLIYVDPPFNTGRQQVRLRRAMVRDPEGDRNAYRSERYRMVRVGSVAFTDVSDDYLAFLELRLVHAHRVLKPTGSLFVHLD